MPSRSPARAAWRDRRWCTSCRGYYTSAYCGCAWAAWRKQAAGAPSVDAPGWEAAPAKDWTRAAWHSQSQAEASWSGSQGRARSTSSGRRRERSLSRQRKPSAAALWGTWEQRESLGKLRAAEKACIAAGDPEGAAAVAGQCDAALETMYEALPMAARIAYWEGRRDAQHDVIARLEELAALQQSKLGKTKTALGAAKQDLATQERKLTDLAAEQTSWGPGSDLAAPDSHGGCGSWDGYTWDYSAMAWVWKDEVPSRPAAQHEDPAIAVSDPYLQADLELKDNLLLLLSQVHAHAPSSNAWQLAEGLQRQTCRLGLQGARVKSEPGSAAPSPTASQASTVPYSPAHHPFRAHAAAAPVVPLPAAPLGAAGAPGSAPSLQARAKAAPRPTGRLIPAKRGGRPVAKRVGVASPARTAVAAVDLQKVRIGASECVIIDDGDMSADGEGFVADLVTAPRAARAAAFPQAAVEAAPALA